MSFSELSCPLNTKLVKYSSNLDEMEVVMNWKNIKERYKNRYSWFFKKEDVLMKVLIATSGLFIGLMVGKGLQALFSTVS